MNVNGSSREKLGKLAEKCELVEKRPACTRDDRKLSMHVAAKSVASVAIAA
jgi:hypothetical protein